MERKVLTRNGFYKNLRRKQFEEVQEFGTRYFKGIVLGKVALKSGENGFINVDELDLSDVPFK
jgi:hypothetical protein